MRKYLFIPLLICLVTPALAANMHEAMRMVAKKLTCASEESYDTGTDNGGLNPSYPKYAQSWASDGGVLDSIKVRLRKVNSPSGNIYIKVYAHSGTFGTSSVPTGTALATSDAKDSTTISTDDTPYVQYTFTFSGSNRIKLASATNYVFAIEYDGANGLKVQLNNSAGGGGNEAYYDTSWHAESGVDMLYDIIVCN